MPTVAPSMNFLHRIREFELNQIIPLIPPNGRLLEIGAGAGWQADILSRRGFSVDAIDLPGSRYAEERIFPVKDYDGERLPFDDNQFDIVFTSHVLILIPDLERIQKEIHRVLKPDGIALHALPTSSWRLWTNVAHFPFLLKAVLRLNRSSKSEGTAKFNIKRPFYRRLAPSRLGVRGNFLSEIYYFSRWWWRRHFHKTDWRLSKSLPNHLFYTGYSVLFSFLPIRLRHALSYILGSSSRFYLLSPSKRNY